MSNRLCKFNGGVWQGKYCSGLNESRFKNDSTTPLLLLKVVSESSTNKPVAGAHNYQELLH